MLYKIILFLVICLILGTATLINYKMFDQVFYNYQQPEDNK